MRDPDVVAYNRCKDEGPFVIQHILFPTDFSETADVAMTYAGELADAFGATLHLIHVLENTNPAGGWAAGTHYVPPPPELIEGMEHEAEKDWSQYARAPAAPGRRPRCWCFSYGADSSFGSRT